MKILPSFCHIPRPWITKCLSPTDTLGFNSDLSDPFGFPWQRPRDAERGWSITEEPAWSWNSATAPQISGPKWSQYSTLYPRGQGPPPGPYPLKGCQWSEKASPEPAPGSILFSVYRDRWSQTQEWRYCLYTPLWKARSASLQCSELRGKRRQESQLWIRGETRSLASQPATAPGPPERSRPPGALFSTPGPAHQTLHPRSWPRRLFGCCWEAWRDLTPGQGEPLQCRGAKMPCSPRIRCLTPPPPPRLRPRPLLPYPPTLPRGAEA